jgi:FkbM family methyltransferase
VSAYTLKEFTQKITKKVETVFELGSRDGIDTIEIYNYYKPSIIHTFEARQDGYGLTLNYIRSQELENVIKCHNLAIYNKVGEETFYIHDDVGSSSLLRHPRDKCKEIIVTTTTLDNFCNVMGIEQVDLICSDIEGAEIYAFENQKILNKVEYIICECAAKNSWKPGFPLLDKLDDVLLQYGLKRMESMLSHNEQAGDFLYGRE